MSLRKYLIQWLSPTPIPIPIPLPEPEPSEFTAEANALLQLHNDVRSGVAQPLTLDPELVVFATHWARTMTRRGLIHSSLNFAGSRKAENIAAGQRSVDAVMAAWLQSRGHRRNIMDPLLSRAGFGLVESKRGVPYWCAVFSRP